MNQLYSWPCVEAQVAGAIENWDASAARFLPGGLRRYSVKEQQKREKAYDETVRAIEREVKRSPGTRSQRIETQDRIVAVFARFAAAALGLNEDAVQLLTNDFLPVATKLAGWARRFDPDLSMADILQACRNAWTACGLQPLLGECLQITPAILGYSLLYPYSDNYLDRGDLSGAAKIHFSQRFGRRLRGEKLLTLDDRESAVWALVGLIEGQYPRADYPQVFDCLLAIHRAQEESIAQLGNCASWDRAEILRITCAKGGTSVLADACLARGWLDEEESRISFEWGVLLQLGDDLQDLHDDMRRGSATLFSRAAELGESMDQLAIQLLSFSERVATRMDLLRHGSATFKELLRMSWRWLIIGAVAEAHEFFSRGFLEEAERCSPFRFGFLRERRERLTGRQRLHATLFNTFLDIDQDEDDGLPLPEYRESSLQAWS